MTSKDIAKYRIEKDCLGNKLIPDDVYHGINTIKRSDCKHFVGNSRL